MADTNDDLIAFYTVVRDTPEELIRELCRLGSDAETYYAVRASIPQSALERAKRIYYLTRFSFNGIYRENLDGEFNVPWGKKVHQSSVDVEAIMAASDRLKRTLLRSQDFRETLQEVEDGDFIYIDPPYLTKQNRGSFVKYNQNIYSWADQVELARLAVALSHSGAHVVVSNAFDTEILALYECAFKAFVIKRQSIIAASSSARTRTGELLLISESLYQSAPALISVIANESLRSMQTEWL